MYADHPSLGVTVKGPIDRLLMPWLKRQIMGITPLHRWPYLRTTAMISSPY